ncbi:hypothetical protein [Aliidiomarina quisquiliarum]|uniref:hypothetical protein n=1 Tax=Aliidiomarina quisquiliarum TaxID=2938947 RepID=UPI00208E9CF2|nr:hypothetical protein [Aliidiomarina quisquiliarum]MCO4321236.1 hypothetical protein [Aliidiomarina quisquiliarum]
MNKISLILLVTISCALLPRVGAAQSITCDTLMTNMAPSNIDYKPLRDISIISLVAVPDRYHEQRVSVVGVFELYYDRISLYVSKDHFNADEASSMVWVNLPQCIDLEDMDEMANWVGKFVRIDGVFNASMKNFAAGTIESVEVVELWHSER